MALYNSVSRLIGRFGETVTYGDAQAQGILAPAAGGTHTCICPAQALSDISAGDTLTHADMDYHVLCVRRMAVGGREMFLQLTLMAQAGEGAVAVLFAGQALPLAVTKAEFAHEDAVYTDTTVGSGVFSGSTGQRPCAVSLTGVAAAQQAKEIEMALLALREDYSGAPAMLEIGSLAPMQMCFTQVRRVSEVGGWDSYTLVFSEYKPLGGV